MERVLREPRRARGSSPPSRCRGVPTASTMTPKPAEQPCAARMPRSGACAAAKRRTRCPRRARRGPARRAGAVRLVQKPVAGGRAPRPSRTPVRAARRHSAPARIAARERRSTRLLDARRGAPRATHGFICGAAAAAATQLGQAEPLRPHSARPPPSAAQLSERASMPRRHATASRAGRGAQSCCR